MPESGQILHSCTFTDRKMAEGKKVIVVGGGAMAEMTSSLESIPNTPCLEYMPTLTPQTTPIDRHIWQSQGAFGYVLTPFQPAHAVGECASPSV